MSTGVDAGHVFHFELQQLHISNTRAVHNDTDTASLALKIGQQPSRVQIKHLGDVNNGDHVVQIKIGPVRLQDHDLVSLVTAVVNAGHQDQGQVDETLTTAANAAIDAALDEVPGGVLLEFFTHWLVNLFAVNCDGVVVGQKWQWRGNELVGHTAAHNPWVITHTYRGSDSPVGCGSNSEYTARWIIRRDP
jgi:hypothetical protein